MVSVPGNNQRQQTLLFVEAIFFADSSLKQDTKGLVFGFDDNPGVLRLTIVGLTNIVSKNRQEIR